MRFQKYDQRFHADEQPDLRFYDLGAEDHYVIARLQNDNEITVTVQNDDEEIVYQEKSNAHAWDSIVSFAKMVLEQDKFIQKELEKRN